MAVSGKNDKQAVILAAKAAQASTVPPVRAHPSMALGVLGRVKPVRHRRVAPPMGGNP